MNVFKKKFIPINKYQNKLKNKNNSNGHSLIKRTNSQIYFKYNNNNEINDLDTINTKSLKNTSSDEVLYLEQKNYDIEIIIQKIQS